MVPVFGKSRCKSVATVSSEAMISITSFGFILLKAFVIFSREKGIKALRMSMDNIGLYLFGPGH